MRRPFMSAIGSSLCSIFMILVEFEANQAHGQSAKVWILCAPDNVGPVLVLNSRKIEQDEIELLKY